MRFLFSIFLMPAVLVGLPSIVSAGEDPSNCEVRLSDGDWLANSLQIKAEVQKVWERKRAIMKVSQAEVARALGTSQSAFSKMLNDSEGHPWTETHLRRFANFIGTPMREFLPEHMAKRIPDFESDGQFLEECVLSVQRFYFSRGWNVSSDQVQGIARDVFEKLNGLRPSREQMEDSIYESILKFALK
jgi:transcriptional regulator with XRE-family HTH domain